MDSVRGVKIAAWAAGAAVLLLAGAIAFTFVRGEHTRTIVKRIERDIGGKVSPPHDTATSGGHRGAPVSRSLGGNRVSPPRDTPPRGGERSNPPGGSQPPPAPDGSGGGGGQAASEPGVKVGPIEVDPPDVVLPDITVPALPPLVAP